MIYAHAHIYILEEKSYNVNDKFNARHYCIAACDTYFCKSLKVCKWKINMPNITHALLKGFVRI